MLTLDKPLLSIVQNAARLVAFKEGSLHFLTVYPFSDRWDVHTRIEVPGSRVLSGYCSNTRHADFPERGTCAVSLEHSARAVFQLLRPADRIRLEWWPDCNSPWLDKHGLTLDLLRLVVERPKGKDVTRLELHLEEQVTGEDNACIRICKGFPKPTKSEAA